MKKYIFPILIIAATLVASSCNKYEAPDFEVPKYNGEPANKTIQDIIDVYEAHGSLDSICHAGETFIVKATVVSSDEGGNYYKTMVLQDETAGIQMQVNASGLCHIYPVGQTVYLDCRGLVVGNYHGVYQIGWIYQGSVGRVDQNFLSQYLHKDGLPVDVTPMITEITSPSDLNSSNVNKLVRIRNCQFAENAVGLPLAEETVTTNRYLARINGSECTNLATRTSNYAKFRKHIIPGGTGDIVGILSVYESSTTTYQLMLRTIDDLGIFGVMGDAYPMTFEGGQDGWTTTGSWGLYASQNSMLHRNVSEACDDWLISPVIPYNTVSGSEVYVDEMFQSIGGVDLDNFSIYYTTVLEGTPNESDWHPLIVNNYPTGTYTQVQVSGLANLTADFRIGFRYKSEGVCTASWAVKGVHFMKLITE